MGVSAFTLAPISEELEDVGGVLEDELLAFRLETAIERGYTYFDVKDGFGDEFHDLSGIASTDLSYDVAGDYLSNLSSPPTTYSDSSTTGATVSTGTNPTVETPTGAGVDVDPYGGTQQVLKAVAGENQFFADNNVFTPGLNGIGDWSLAFWFRTGVTSASNLFEQYDSVTSNRSWFTQLNAAGVGSFSFYTYPSGSSGTGAVGINTSSGVVPTNNSWVYAVITFNSTTNEGKVYINGTERASGTFNPAFNPSSDFEIAPTGDVYFDEVRIFNSLIDPATPVSRPAVTTEVFYCVADAAIGGDGSVTSITATANAVPDTGRIVAFHDQIDSLTLNTDIVFEVTRCGGAQWTAAEVAKDYTILQTLDLLSSNGVDLSGQPAGVDMAIRATTANSKIQRLHAWGLQWG